MNSGKRENTRLVCLGQVFGLSLCLAITLPISVGAQSLDTNQVSVYVFNEGDTLYELAARLSMSVEELERMNSEHPLFFRSGDSLLVPLEKLARTYVVRRGDTLFALSRRFGISVSEIQLANSMSNANLRVGQRMTIPGQGVRASIDIDDLNKQSRMSAQALAYAPQLAGHILSSGQRYDPSRYLISHPNFPEGSIVWIQSENSGEATFAEVADRGFAGSPLVIDVSEAVAKQLGIDSSASVWVQLIHGTE